MCQNCIANMIEKGILQWDELYPDAGILEEDILQNTMFTATDTFENILGCIVLNTCQDEAYQTIDWQYTKAPAAVIHRLMVTPAAEGTGVAHQLLAYAENIAFLRGFGSIRLDVFSENPRAVAFYEQYGYGFRGSVQFRKGLFYCAEKELP